MSWDRDGLSRRQVLTLGAAATAASLLRPLGGLRAAPGAELPFAFMRDSDLSADLEELADSIRFAGAAPAADLDGAILDPATFASIGDPTLASSLLRITIDPLPGLSGAIRRAGVESARLRLWFPAQEAGGEPVPFRAWEWRRSAVVSEGSGIRFDVPSGERGELDLSLDLAVPRERARRPTVRSSSAGPAGVQEPSWTSRLEGRLTSGIADGLPKLQRGLYVVGLLPGQLRQSLRLTDLLESARFAGLLMAVELAADLPEG